jgi:hypothetical protein
VAHFCSGHVYFTQQMYKTLGIRPYAVHATFQFSGTPGKRHRFRDAGLWLEDEHYYHPPGESSSWGPLGWTRFVRLGGIGGPTGAHIAASTKQIGLLAAALI